MVPRGDIVLLSACNPGGRRRADGWNRRMMRRLASALAGLPHVLGKDGWGGGPNRFMLSGCRWRAGSCWRGGSGRTPWSCCTATGPRGWYIWPDSEKTG
ncbi:hypothetical protein RAA17_06695 [Komagataeibacter rhaeticus]|nr:hypothetical protein [Komagataeibacter rhaeticus]